MLVHYWVCPVEAWVCAIFCSVMVQKGDGCTVLSARLRLGASRSEVWSSIPVRTSPALGFSKEPKGRPKAGQELDIEDHVVV